MTTMDKVTAIKADIANLPKEYRSLIVAEQTFEAAHPVLYAIILLSIGAIGDIIMSLKF